jgi:plasmid stabilization system protein ParE
MERRVLWTERSLDDLDEIRAYLQQFNPGSVDLLVESLLVTSRSLMADRGHDADGLSALNEMGPERMVQAKMVQEKMAVDPYFVRYRIAGDIIFILRVRHRAGLA